MTANRFPATLVVASALAGLMLVNASCNSSKSDPPAPTSSRDREVLVQPGVPGGVEVRTYRATANVTALDKTKRTVTFVGTDGKKQTVTCGPEVKNFDQIKVGQQIKAELIEQVAVYMATEEPTVKAGEVTMLALPPQGGKPAAVAANTTQVVATVTAIDSANRRATLKFPDGSTRDVKVRNDIDLSQRKVGEQVVIRVTEAIAIAVDEP